MALSAPVNIKPRLFRRMASFGWRTVASVCITTAALAILKSHVPFVADRDEIIHPLLKAAASADVVIHQTELLVWAPVPTTAHEVPSFRDLKQLAATVAATFSPEEDPNYWSATGTGYRVVYYQGSEPLGGRWIASARHLDQDMLQGTEIALYRLIYGPYDDLWGAVEMGKNHLRRAGFQGLGKVQVQLKISGRPLSDKPAEDLAYELLHAVGADIRFVTEADEGVVVGGFSPQLPGRETYREQAVNVIARVFLHGQSSWVELSHPAL